VSSKGIERLRAFPNLESLGLAGLKKLGDEDLRQLAQIETLVALDIHDTKISDAGLAHLDPRKITFLKVTNCKRVTDAGVKPFTDGHGIRVIR
jgi:hypothetical protein